MQTNIIINIGLSFPPIDVHTALDEIRRAGITILASGIVAGEWEGKPEQTLVVSGLAYETGELRARLYVAACSLNQDSIAIYSNGLGQLVGRNAHGYEFDAELFHFHPRALQALPEVDGWESPDHFGS